MANKQEKVISYIQSNQLDKADQAFDELLGALKQSNSQVIAENGYQFAQLGMVDYAKRLYDLGKELFPNEEIWGILMGELMVDNGDLEAALDALLSISNQSDYYLNSLLLQADAYQMLALPEVALVKLTEAAEIAPEEKAIAFGLAELEFDQGHFQEALPLYKNLLADASGLNADALAKIRDHYAYALTWLGDWETATDLLESIPEKDRSTNIKQQLAFNYYQLANYEKANSIFQQLNEDEQLSDDFLPLFATTKTHFYEYEEAKELLQAAIAKNPFHAPNYLQAAEIDEKLGNKESAFKLLEQAVDLDPDYSLAQLKMLELAIDQEDYDLARGLMMDMDRQDFVDPHYAWLKAKVYQEIDIFDQAKGFYDEAYDNLADNLSFIEDYFAFLQEMGDWKKIGELLKDHPNYRQAMSLQMIIARYEELEDDF